MTNLTGKLIDFIMTWIGRNFKLVFVASVIFTGACYEPPPPGAVASYRLTTPDTTLACYKLSENTGVTKCTEVNGTEWTFFAPYNIVRLRP